MRTQVIRYGVNVKKSWLRLLRRGAISLKLGSLEYDPKSDLEGRNKILTFLNRPT